MPSRKKTKKTKKNFKKKYFKKSKYLNEIPQEQYVNLHYQEMTQIQYTSDVGTTQVYAMNSPYDPYFASAGESCSMFGAWANLYHKYISPGCKVELDVVITANDSFSGVIGLIADDAATSPPSTASLYGSWLTESKNAVFKNLDPYVSGNPYQHIHMKKYFSVAYSQGLKGELDIEDYAGSVTADPPIQPKVYLVMATTNGTATMAAKCRIRITYPTRFFIPKIGENAVA